MVDIRNLRGRDGANSRTTTLDFWRAKFVLFNDLLGRIPWDMALKRSPGELVVFQWSPPPSSRMVCSIRQKWRKAGRRPAWMSKGLTARLTHKKEVYRRWKQGQIAWEKYWDTVWPQRDGLRKAKAHLELSIARDLNSNKEDFLRDISSKRLGKTWPHS